MKGKRKSIFGILFFLLFFTLGLFYLFGPVTGTNKSMNILLIGNNARDATNPLSLGSAAGQADILIVAHIDPDKQKVTLISIPRDTLISMPDWKEPIPKIKSSFELGLKQSPEDGPKLAMEYVSKLTGMKIDYYMVTYFQGFADAVDAVNGIQVNIPKRLYDPKHSGADLQPGLQTLNGQQALAFIRIRQNVAGNGYRTNDFQRQDAELEVLKILKNKLSSQEISLSEIKKLQQIWQHDITTNIPISLLLGLGMKASGSQLEQVTLGSIKDSMYITKTPVKGMNQDGYLSGAYYDVLDPMNIEQKLKPYGARGAMTGLPPFPDPKTVTVHVYGSQFVANELKNAGFHAVWLGLYHNRGQIKIYYPSGNLIAGCKVAQVLGTANELVSPAQSAKVVTVYAP